MKVEWCVPWPVVRPVYKVHLSGQNGQGIRSWLKIKRLEYFFHLGGAIILSPLQYRFEEPYLPFFPELEEVVASGLGTSVEPMLYSEERGGMNDDGLSGAASVVFGGRGKLKAARTFANVDEPHAVFVTPHMIYLTEVAWENTQANARITQFSLIKEVRGYFLSPIIRSDDHASLSELKEPEFRSWREALVAAKAKSLTPRCNRPFHLE